MVISGLADKYKASLTREQFLFKEMRVTARLMETGMSDAEVVQHIIEDNAFQYPSSKSYKQMADVCLKRLRNMGDDALITAVAKQPAEEARQICLYALMKQNKLVWEFMLAVIGEKYRQQNLHFSKRDINEYFFQIREQDEAVAKWSDSTFNRLRNILLKLLVDNEYLDKRDAERLNPVWMYPLLENSLRERGEEALLPAFNKFG